MYALNMRKVADPWLQTTAPFLFLALFARYSDTLCAHASISTQRRMASYLTSSVPLGKCAAASLNYALLLMTGPLHWTNANRRIRARFRQGF